jgi:response regulator of citrate/malate metabolism
VEVDGEPGGLREVIKDLFEVRNMLRNSANDDECVVSILKDRTEEVINERVEEEPLPRGLQNHLLQDIHNNIEEERGEGVSLSEAAAALDPSSRHPV